MVSENDLVQLLCVVTLSVMVYKPGAVKLCDGCSALEVPPSPKSQTLEIIGSFLVVKFLYVTTLWSQNSLLSFPNNVIAPITFILVLPLMVTSQPEMVS